jgi:hypothetical protein
VVSVREVWLGCVVLFLRIGMRVVDERKGMKSCLLSVWVVLFTSRRRVGEWSVRVRLPGVVIATISACNSSRCPAIVCA